MTGDTRQASIQPFDDLNRYDGRDEEWPSDEVFAPPRRTMANYWVKFHADRDCGKRNVRFVEDNSHHTTSERYEYDLVCWGCGYEIPETEVLFIGGDWWHEHGCWAYGRPLDDLFMPPERVLELGPDPDEDELLRALNLGRIERGVGPFVGGPIRKENWRACEECGHEVPLLFDDRCRMCYDGEWTDRMMNGVVAYERKVREWHNSSFGHRLENHVDPLSIGGRAHQGSVLWRRHAMEPTRKLVIVHNVLEDVDDGHREYILQDPTHTEVYRYREEDLADCFWDTGLDDRELRGIGNDEVREAYQQVCRHSFSEVHRRMDDGELVPDGKRCIHCKVDFAEVADVGADGGGD